MPILLLRHCRFSRLLPSIFRPAPATPAPDSFVSGSLAALAALLLVLALQGCSLGPVVRDVALPGPPTVLLAAGDIADCRRVAAHRSGAEKTAKRIERELAQWPSAQVLTLGDNTYPVGLPAEFSDCYHPTWGRFKERTLPAAGNHDYYTKGAAGYYGYFGARAGPQGKGYYATNAGSWKLIALNSALPRQALSAQLEWLKAELATTPSLCTLAFFHHPPFSSGGRGNNPAMLPLWQMLVAGGVDVVLTAHDHHYERFAPMNGDGVGSQGGTRQFVVGTGGATLSWLSLPLPASEARSNSGLGVLKLELRDGGYSWDFLAADAATFTDRGHGLCH